MEQKIIQIGNSLGVILPKRFRQTLKVDVGDTVVLKEHGQEITIFSKKQQRKHGVDAKFFKMVDEFITENEDVLKELANR